MLELRKKYETGVIDANEYIDSAMKFHTVLMQYPMIINKLKYVQGIHITDRGVALEIVDDLCMPKTVKMLLSSEKDSRCFSMHVLNFGKVEDNEMHILRRITDVAEIHSFFDIGANEGWYSFHMMSRLPDILCYSFEPIPETYHRAKANLQINGMSVENLFNIGLSDVEKREIFYFDNAESGATSMQNIREKKNITEVECSLRRLDNVVEELGIASMDLMKIDVEGSELMVLKGGMHSIEKYKPVIFCEMLRKWSAKFGYHPNDIIHLLEGTGYKCYVQNGAGGLKEFGYVTDETVETNYFFLHPEVHGKVINELLKD